MKAENIRVEINRPGEGIDSHDYDHCPIQFAVDGHTRANTCPLKPGVDCRLGLTAIAPPDDCPLRKACGDFVMRFSISPANA